LREIVAPAVWKAENTAVGVRRANHVALSNHKFGINFADKRWSLGLYNSLSESGLSPQANYTDRATAACQRS
jgi:hypothetical protein